MEIFGTLLIVLFLFTAVFYIVFFSFIYYWHLRKRSFVIVPFLFAFEFFVAGFLIVAAVTIIATYIPHFINLLSS